MLRTLNTFNLIVLVLMSLTTNAVADAPYRLSFTDPQWLEASFDCNNAATTEEKFICASSDLRSLDRLLGLIYSDYSETFKVQVPGNMQDENEPEFSFEMPHKYGSMSELLAEQREWLRDRERVIDIIHPFKSETSLQDFYINRISELATSVVNLTFHEGSNGRLRYEKKREAKDQRCIDQDRFIEWGCYEFKEDYMRKMLYTLFIVDGYVNMKWHRLDAEDGQCAGAFTTTLANISDLVQIKVTDIGVELAIEQRLLDELCSEPHEEAAQDTSMRSGSFGQGYLKADDYRFRPSR